MNLGLFNQNITKILTAIALIVCIVDYSYANNLNEVIISGQVTNFEYGNPVVGHPVYIESELDLNGTKAYSSVVYTDKEGYYNDTITTSDNKGSFFIYTFDHYGETIDTTLHFRFLERNISMVIADFKIYLPFQSEEIQARFKYLQRVSDNGSNYNFFDLTNNTNIINWEWDFGDGTKSSLQNPIHEYLSYGLFRVSLNVTAILNGSLITSEITKQIYITRHEYFHLGGHVFSDYFPIDQGYAYLYSIDSAMRYTSIDTMAFDTLGYYYFYQIPEGHYIVKGEPMVESAYYGKLLPSYYGNTLYWEEAEIIDLSQTSWEYNIKLEPSSGFASGNGGISGNVEYVNVEKTGRGYSAKGVNIYLFDDSNNLLTCHYTDDNGDFIFDLIKLNTYWIYPEVTGISAERIPVELTIQEPVVSDIEISILSSSISAIEPGESDPQNELVGQPYPNPVSDIFTLPIHSISAKNVSYEIYDMFGKLVISNSVNITSSDGISISTSEFKNGMYIIRAVIENQKFDKVFLVAR